MSTAHSATSNAARRKNSGIYQQLIRAYLSHERKGACCWQLEEFFGWPHQTISAVLSNLEAAGELCRNGQTRKSPAGVASYVYFDLAYVEPEDREPVIRRGKKVVDWLPEEPQDSMSEDSMPDWLLED